MDSVIRSLTGTHDHPQLTFRRTYRATPDDVLDACTSPERLARWFGVVDGEPKAVGDTFTARLSESPDDAAVGRVLHCGKDEFRVTWSWQGEPESTITVRVTAIDAALSELALHHALALPDHAAGYGGGWEQLLAGLSRSLGDATGDAVPDDQIEAAAIETWRTITRAPLELEHYIDAPVEQVWEAFATAEGLKQWWWRHWDDVEIEADARVGGVYRISAPGVGITLEGTYLVVDAPEHLAFSWVWKDTDGESRDEAVDVRLHADRQGTRVTIRHSGPWTDDAPAESYRQGWEFTLSQLEAAVEPGHLR